MGKRGAKPKGKVKIKWSPNFAYGIGLLVTDGCLSGDGRHIDFTSKDKEQIDNFLKAFHIVVSVGLKDRGDLNQAFRVQFGDVLFYRFLLEIGITPAKSLTLDKIKIPDEYFFDFVRGCFDGDGYSYSYWDKRWKSSFMFYIGFASASKKYIDWFRSTVSRLAGLAGHITKATRNNSCHQLKYAKREAIELFSRMHVRNKCIRLSRKYLKIKETLAIVGGLSGRT